MKNVTLDTLHLPQIEDAVKVRLLQLLSHINGQLKSDHLFVARVNKSKTTACVIAHLCDGVESENFDYSLEGTPCEDVSQNQVCSVTSEVSRLFPDDLLLRDMAIEGYLGVPLLGANDKAIGILVSLYKTPVSHIESHQVLFQTFATLIVAELQNLHNNQRIQNQIALLNEVGEIARTGGWEYDLIAQSMIWTDEVYRIYGLHLDTELTPEIGINHYHEQAQEVIRQHFHKAVNQGIEYCVELPFKDAQGRDKWVRTSGKPVKNEAGHVIKVYGAFEDISTEKELLTREREQKDYLSAVLDNLNDAVVTIDEQGLVVQANLVAAHMFGYDMDELSGMAVTRFMPKPYSESHQQYMENYLATGEAHIIGVGRQLPAIRKNGEVFQMELSLSETVICDKRIFIGVIRDISERLEAEDAIYKLAYNDRITGLPNKIWFEKEMNDLLLRANQAGGFIYCSLIDIDNLCHVNLRHSNAVGDEVIRSIAEQLSMIANDKFKLYKSGADSFYLVGTEPLSMEELTPFKYDHIETLLDKYNRSVMCLGKNELTVTYSRGSVIYDSRTTQLESLVGLLEYAKHEAKSFGSGGAFFVDKEATGSYERTTLLQQELKHALKNNEFYLVMQPQYDQHQRIQGAEALIRWDNPTLGLVPPDEFIPMAEQSDLILQIGDWVIGEVCRHIHALNQQGKSTNVSINVSARQIANSDFKYKLVRHLERWQVSSKDIMLELTETTLVTNIALVKQVMEELKSLGFCFSIDDFGTGYSSLAYLKTLPISELKIDRCFVNDLKPPFAMVDVSIVNMIVDMSRALNVKTVAEGVENQEQLDYLTSRGCDYYQGYYLSRPVSIEQWMMLYHSQDVAKT